MGKWFVKEICTKNNVKVEPFMMHLDAKRQWGSMAVPIQAILSLPVSMKDKLPETTA